MTIGKEITMDPLNLHIGLTQLPWPNETSHVFLRGEPSRRVAWIPNDAAQWHRYACGYKEAAERVYESWVALSDDSLVFPIVFLFRHYVELRLKELMQSAENFLDLPSAWQSNHNIAELWENLSLLLPKIFPDEPQVDLENTGRLLRELAEGDPYSFHFRYPENKKGQQYLEDIERLDVVSFTDAMRRLSAFLDGASMALSVYTENQRTI